MTIALLTAAGNGTRMGQDVPKRLRRYTMKVAICMEFLRLLRKT